MKYKKPSITFIFNSFSAQPWGGAKIIFWYANSLSAMGCKVTICFDCGETMSQRHIPKKLKHFLCQLAVAYEPRWYPLNKKIEKKCIFGVNNMNVPDADHVVATAVETALPVSKLASEKGKKHYLIQDFEAWNVSEDFVKKTFRLGMSNIVISQWLKNLVEDECGIAPTLIRNPIDESIFYPSSIKRNDNEVAVLYHLGKHKGFADLWKALCIVKEKYPELKVNAFGSPSRPKWFPDWVEYTRNANPNQLRQIYSRSLVYACATVKEGFGLTLAESMFCGCALASTSFQGVREYADNNCALLSPVGDYNKLADNILKLLSDSTSTSALAIRGREHAMNACSMKHALEKMRDEFDIH